MEALVVASVVLILLFLVFGRPKPDVTGDEARQLVEDGAKLVDVRTPSEFGAGHIGDAVNVPLADLDGRLAELGDKDAPIVVYCASGMRSAQAKKLLVAEGFTKVHDLGSRMRWRT